MPPQDPLPSPYGGCPQNLWATLLYHSPWHSLWSDLRDFHYFQWNEHSSTPHWIYCCSHCCCSIFIHSEEGVTMKPMLGDWAGMRIWIVSCYGKKIQTLLHLNRWSNDTSYIMHQPYLAHSYIGGSLVSTTVYMINATTMSWLLWYGRTHREIVDRWFKDLQSIMHCRSISKSVSTSLIKWKQTPNLKQQSTYWQLNHSWRVRPMSWRNTQKYCATIRLVDIWSSKGHNMWRGISYHCYGMPPTLWRILALHLLLLPQ